MLRAAGLDLLAFEVLAPAFGISACALGKNDSDVTIGHSVSHLSDTIYFSLGIDSPSINKVIRHTTTNNIKTRIKGEFFFRTKRGFRCA